jgi:hypothetical protein
MRKSSNKLYAETFMDMANMLDSIDIRHPGGLEDVPLFSYLDVDIFFRTVQSASGLDPRCEGSNNTIIEENRVFSYPIFVPAGAAVKNQQALILLHGLNERRWEKYLPWAYNLCRETGRTVILFPIAYHVNRAPSVWSNVRSMMPLMNLRKKSSTHNTAVSFANAALSQRIDEKPERFITGALQTINDVERLVGRIRNGQDPFVAENASIHFFSYSIGCSLAEILLMLDEDREEKSKLFSESRVCLFCGGSILEYANPVSRAILDADAFSRLDHYFNEFGNLQNKGTVLSDLRRQIPGVGTNLFSILSSLMKTRFVPGLRNRNLIVLKNRFKGFMISTDKVFPVGGLRRTWEDTEGNSLISVNEYRGVPGSSHEVPFPVSRDTDENRVVNEEFLHIFSDAVDFLESPLLQL